jgi:hypothetical protein
MIILKKNSIIRANDFEPHEKGYKQRRVSSVIPYLSEEIQLEKGFTLSDLFKIIEKEKEVFEVIFSSQMGHFPIQPFIDEIKKRVKKAHQEEIEFLECYWVAEQFDYAEGPRQIDDGENEITISVGFHGNGVWSDPPESFEKDANGEVRGGIAIEFTALNELKHFPIELDRRFVIGPKNYEQGENLVEGVRDFTVYEVFGAILSELTFCGLPEDRDSQWEEIEADYKDMQERLDRGEEIGIPLEEIKEQNKLKTGKNNA